MTTLTTSDLAGKLVEFLPQAFDTKSALSVAGATRVNFNTDIVKNVSAGGASVVLEGAVKPESNISSNEAPLVQAKLVHLFTTTDEFENTAEGQETLSRFLQETTASLIKSFDILVLNGTDPATGDQLAGQLLSNAVVSKATSTEFDADEDEINEALYEALGQIDRPDYLLLSNPGYAAVGFSPENFGNALNIKRDAEFTYGPGIPTHRFQAVGLDGYTDTADVKNDVLAVSGPFDKVVRAVNSVEVRKSTEATIGDVNMFVNNMSAYIVEVGVKYYNLAGNGEFATLVAA